MLSLKEFKRKVGVTKNTYVQKWIDEGLIPGVKAAPSLEDTLFPDSARRPYKERDKIKATSGADHIRAHIVSACIRREYISNKMCFCTPKEFSGYIKDLVDCGLIREREEDNIIYYDATEKCDEIKTAKHNAIVKFIADTLQKAAIEAGKTALAASLKQ